MFIANYLYIIMTQELQPLIIFNYHFNLSHTAREEGHIFGHIWVLFGANNSFPNLYMMGNN